MGYVYFFFFSSRRRHTRLQGDWSSDVCSSDLVELDLEPPRQPAHGGLECRGSQWRDRQLEAKVARVAGAVIARSLEHHGQPLELVSLGDRLCRRLAIRALCCPLPLPLLGGGEAGDDPPERDGVLEREVHRARGQLTR